MEVQNHLALWRSKRGLGATQLSAMVGVSRQSIYDIESGNYVPNTAVSLRLAQVLEATVEELFQIVPEEKVPAEVLEVTVLGDTAEMAEGQPLRLCDVNGNIVAIAPEPGRWGLSPTDALLITPLKNPKKIQNATVQVISNEWKKSDRIVLAGCDPSASILAHILQLQGCELVIAYENSTHSLELLQQGLVHIAGTHMAEKASDKADLLPITQMFGRKSVAVISYALWQEGLLVAKGNPKRINGIEDLARENVCITNREPGAGCHRLLDEMLATHKIASGSVRGYDRVTLGHLPAGRLVQSGAVDSCISTQAVARSLGLEFVPLQQKPYQLVLRRSQLDLPPVQTLLSTLSLASFRREMEACTGYNLRNSGDRII